MGVVALALLLVFVCAAFASCKNSGQLNPYRHATVTEDFKTEYFVGEQLVVSGSLRTYFDETTFDVIPITAEMISDFDTSRPGDIIVKVTYGEFVATVPVRVNAVNAVSLTIDESTLPTVIYTGNPFPSGIIISAELSNGDIIENIPVTTSMIGGFDPSVEGAQTLSIGYGGASASFSVTVKRDVPVSITLRDAKTNYRVYGVIFKRDIRF